VSYLVWSPDGERLAVCGSRLERAAVRVVSVEDARELLVLRGEPHGFLRVAWSGDGRWLATAGLHVGEAQIWDATTGEEISAFREAKGSYALAFSSDGRRLAVGCAGPHAKSGGIVVWNVDTGKRLHTLSGHDGPVQAMAWTATDDRLVTAGGTQTIIWDMTIGQQVLNLKDSENRQFQSLTLSPDGRQLSTSVWKTPVTIRVNIWDATAGYERSATLPSEYFKTYYKGGGFF
jgi:WD40 repeat protein